MFLHKISLGIWIILILVACDLGQQSNKINLNDYSPDAKLVDVGLCKSSSGINKLICIDNNYPKISFNGRAC